MNREELLELIVKISMAENNGLSVEEEKNYYTHLDGERPVILNGGRDLDKENDWEFFLYDNDSNYLTFFLFDNIVKEIMIFRKNSSLKELKKIVKKYKTIMNLDITIIKMENDEGEFVWKMENG